MEQGLQGIMGSCTWVFLPQPHWEDSKQNTLAAPQQAVMQMRAVRKALTEMRLAAGAAAGHPWRQLRWQRQRSARAPAVRAPLVALVPPRQRARAVGRYSRTMCAL